MFKANVGLSRKISRDYNSTGYTVNLEGEIVASLNEPDLVLKQIHNLFVLAENALAQEVDRDQGEQAQGRRDEPRPPNGNGRPEASQPPNQNYSRGNGNGTGNANGNGQSPDPASEKQVNYLQSLAKRQKLSQAQLDDQIAQVLGQRVSINHLTKKEAGRVIESMTQTAPSNGRG